MRHAIAKSIKGLLYGSAGEPFRLPTGEKLRFAVGTRPVRTRYANGPDLSARYDALQIVVMCARLKQGSAAFDVGANVGSTTLVMAARCGTTGRVVAFEPDPEARKMLRRNIGLNPGAGAISIEEAACSADEGTATFYARGDARSSLDGNAGDPSEKPMIVPLTTLDAYSERAAVTPDLVKIDVEGAEVAVLRGAQRLLASNATILCELHPFAWERNGVSLADLISVLKPSGRRIRYLGADTDFAGEPEYGIAELIR
jgi:FkbM family methyltransferase